LNPFVLGQPVLITGVLTSFVFELLEFQHLLFIVFWKETGRLERFSDFGRFEPHPPPVEAVSKLFSPVTLVKSWNSLWTLNAHTLLYSLTTRLLQLPFTRAMAALCPFLAGMRPLLQRRFLAEDLSRGVDFELH